jgi:hypothetical protein
MFRPIAVAFIAISSVCLLPALSVAQDVPLALQLEAPDSPQLGVRMTMPAGTDWQPNLRVSPPERGGLLPTLYVTLVGLQVYDGYSTSRGLKNGASESNPFMASIARHPGALWAAKGGASFVSIFMAERLWRQNRRGQAVAVMLLTNGLMTAVAASNRSIVRAQQ